MSTKECPSCGAEVPTSASRCKECFHDFTEVPARRGLLAGPLILLASFAMMAVVGALTLFIIASRPVEERILVDEDTRSVVWTRKYRTGVETDRLMWDQILKLEYVIKASGGFEIVAIEVDGSRHVIHEDLRPLKSEATHYAKVMEKPLEEVDNTSGFHKLDEG
jgi:hypothetical protein